ncbi:unnamed protein product [Psylliodes chrysocephalus]|uniref:Uncharacterized protein n=1 Tax=Psylliodes chrysocephalus TaxID=3402493 RepID=A0A9P0CF09_9CUCU|nr:unnamed protein product [Psylliodes chrysocephala]
MKKHHREFTSKYCKVILFACMFVITVVEISSKPQGIDCRKHLYAPICRGVAAKRDGPYSYSDDGLSTPVKEELKAQDRGKNAKVAKEPFFSKKPKQTKVEVSDSKSDTIMILELEDEEKDAVNPIGPIMDDEKVAVGSFILVRFATKKPSSTTLDLWKKHLREMSFL